jgi:hypothetical protein
MTLRLGLLLRDHEEAVEGDSEEVVIPETSVTRVMDQTFHPIDGEMEKTDGNDAHHLEGAHHHQEEEEHLHVTVEMIENFRNLSIQIEPD